MTRQYHLCPNDIVISKGLFKCRFPKHLNNTKSIGSFNRRFPNLLNDPKALSSRLKAIIKY